MIGLAIGLADSAWAQDARNWPDKPVHVVVPLTAGSATDVMARRVAKQLGEQLGQPFIVDNKPGADGTIGTGAVARAKAGGYSLLVQSASYTVTPITYPNTQYDTRRDLMGVTPLGLTEVLAGRVDYYPPREIVQKLYAETAKAIESPELRAGMSQLGAEASLAEPDAYNLQLKKDIADNAALVKAAGIPINGGQLGREWSWRQATGIAPSTRVR